MRIIGGTWRGRALRAPAGDATRPTADRVRQALFDMLLHAPWAGREWIEGARVLDVFAGTGALGLEALSRGAAHASFLEKDPAALAVLRGNVALCGAEARCTVIRGDALRPARGTPCGLIFLDPPYGLDLVRSAVTALHGAGWIAPSAVLVAESGRNEPDPLREVAGCTKLAERAHGAAAITVWRYDGLAL